MSTTELRRPSDEPAWRARASTSGVTVLPPELTGDGGRAFVLQWILTRAAMFALLVSVEGAMTGDVSYYARSLHGLFASAGIRGTLQEYPVPVLGIMAPQYLLGVMNSIAFTVLFALSMLGVDAAFTRLLWRSGGGQRSVAATFWLWFVPAIGPIAYFRFDIVPAVLAGTAVLVVARRPAWAGALTAVGAGLKLWPAIMLPVFLLRRGGRRRVLAGFLGAGLGLALISVALGGLRRSLSPLHWQTGRGLQVESVAAGPVMLARMVHPHGVWNITLSIYKAFEVTGAGVRLFLALSTVATALGIVVLAVLWDRARRMPDVSLELVGWLVLTTATVLTVTNKVLSPQYVIWLAGPLAVLLVLVPSDDTVRRATRLLLTIAVLTQLTFPVLYPYLVRGGWAMPIATVTLQLRNLLLLWFTWRACRQTWRLSRTVSAPRRAGP